MLGYPIGALLYDSVGHWLIQLYGYGDKVDAFRAAYAQWGAWIILLKGLTPIPYKIVTITSGFAGYNFWLFVGLSFVARGMRFYLLAFLLNRYGPQARAIIEERLGFWVTLAPWSSSSASWLRYTCSEACYPQFCHRIRAMAGTSPCVSVARNEVGSGGSPPRRSVSCRAGCSGRPRRRAGRRPPPARPRRRAHAKARRVRIDRPLVRSGRQQFPRSPARRQAKMDELGDDAVANSKDISDKAAKVGQGAAEVGKGAAEATKNAVDAVAKLPTARMMSGRERCANAPNGAPDCVAAAEALCRKHGCLRQEHGFHLGRGMPAQDMLGQAPRGMHDRDLHQPRDVPVGRAVSAGRSRCRARP